MSIHIRSSIYNTHLMINIKWINMPSVRICKQCRPRSLSNLSTKKVWLIAVCQSSQATHKCKTYIWTLILLDYDPEFWCCLNKPTQFIPHGGFLTYAINRNCLGQFRGFPWNQTTDVHRGSTLITRVITWRWRYITWRWRNENHVETQVWLQQHKWFKWSLCFFSIKYRHSDILLKKINFIYSADSTFRIIRIIDFNRAEPTCY